MGFGFSGFSNFGFWDLGFGVLASFSGWGFGVRDVRFGVRVSGLCSEVWGSGFGIWD